MRRSLAPFGLCLGVLTGSCSGGGGDGTTEPTPTPSISVSVSPGSTTIVAGTSGEASVTVGRAGEYSGSITLSLEGAPAGVTGSFSASVVPDGSTSSTLTFGVAPTATPGQYTLTVRATGTGVSARTATISLTIAAPPSFSIASAASALNVTQGQTAGATINITRGGGFAGGVTLALQNAPAGLTGDFTPNPATGASSSLTVSASASAAPGTHNVTVRGTATGLPDATVVIAVTVIADDGSFSLSLSPAALNITQGTNSNTTVTITRTAPFAGSVTLALDGAPNGVTGAFAPNPAPAGSSTLTVTVGAAVAPGIYNLSVRGSAAGAMVIGRDSVLQAVAERSVALSLTVAVAGTYTLAATNASAAQGASGQSTVTVTRNGGFAGNVTLSLEGAPTGVTGAFAPNPATGASSTLTLNVGGAVAIGNYDLTVRGVTPGLADRTTTFQLSATGPAGFTLSSSPSAISVVAGGNNGSTITVNRTGGFAAAVTLTHTTNAPGGVMVVFAPSSTTGGNSTMTVTATAGVAAGVYSITVRGNSTGQSEQTTIVQLTITPAGSGNVTWSFCAQTGNATWLAYQDGPLGTWTRVTPTGNSFNFNITQVKGAVAWVILNGAKAQVSVTYGSLAELQAAAPTCVGAGGTKTLNGTVSGMAPGQRATIYVGGGSASTTLTNFSVPGVREGNVDAFISTGTFFPPTVSKFAIRRSFNLADGATMPDFDMAGAAEAFTPLARTVTVNNSFSSVNAAVTYLTANGTAAPLYNYLGAVGGNTATWYGVPTDRQADGDLHMLVALEAQGAFTWRTVTRLFKTATDQNVTLGDFAPNFTTLSFTNAAYVLPRAAFQIPADYNRMWMLNWSNRGGTQNSWNITVWEGYGMGSVIDYTIPDFSAVAGFNNVWGIQAGTGFATDALLQVNGWTVGAGPGLQPWSEGSVIITAARTQPITP